jgi:hypothetical protein
VKIVDFARPMLPMHSWMSFIVYLSVKGFWFSSRKSWTIWYHFTPLLVCRKQDCCKVSPIFELYPDWASQPGIFLEKVYVGRGF